MRHFIPFILTVLLLSALPLSTAFAYDDLGKSKGQIIYVPVYSHVYHGAKNRPVQLTTILSFRNTNRRSSLTITAVKYYDTHGNLVRNYIREPTEVPSMATQEYIVDLKDTSGGSGANFIIEWENKDSVFNPVVEALMISTESSLGISFVRPGRVVSEVK